MNPHQTSTGGRGFSAGNTAEGGTDGRHAFEMKNRLQHGDHDLPVGRVVLHDENLDREFFRRAGLKDALRSGVGNRCGEEAVGAEEFVRHDSPEGAVLHAKVRIGDSMIEMGEAHGPWQAMPTAIYLYVPDADAVYRRAMAAGADSLSEPADQPWGDRLGGVRDFCGNQWFIATHVG